MKEKLTSRKFWVAIFGLVLGTVILVTGISEESEVVMAIKTGFGALINILVSLGYLIAEAKIDAARAPYINEK